VSHSKLIAVAIVVGLLAGGVPLIAGLHILWNTAVSQEKERFQAVAVALLARAEYVLDGSTRLLKALASEADSGCSDAHVAALQAATISTVFVNEIGVFLDQQLACTSSHAVDIPWRTPALKWRSRTGFGVLPVEGSIRTVQELTITLTYRNHALAIDPTPITDIIADTGPGVSAALMNRESYEPFVAIGKPQILDADTIKLGAGTVYDGDRLVAFVSSSIFPVFAIAGETDDRLLKHWRSNAVSLGAVAVLVAGVAAVLVYLIGRWRLSPESAIRYAVRRREITAKYQPVIDLNTGACVGAEALARWSRADGTVVRPDAFIPFAEDNGLIEMITDQMLNRVAEDLGELLRTRKDLHVSINITPRELQNDRIVDLMNQMTEQSRIEPRQVSLEATERSLMDTNSANGIIRKLRKGGYSISIDDFGTGYSSLSYLQTLDVDNLKIDKCFIEAIDAEAATSGVVSHIIEMARTLKLVMIAEGVETEAQAEFLRDRGVQYAQGWLFSKALTRDQFVAFAQTNPRRSENRKEND
jgi:sensor c-di-GMP phosphodiesterase-like protein